jgi:GDP-L-fucose synthase
MKKDAKIYVAGHQGLVGSAVTKYFQQWGYTNLVTRSVAELDLRRQADVEEFFAQERPEFVVLAAAKVGGILANNTYSADFIYDNLMIATNVIHAAYQHGVKRLVNLGSSCIYPKNAPQPLNESYLLTGPLEETNEPYAIAKIAAIKLCRYYNKQYGTQFISLMPTNLYGLHDNFNLETSHVLPALMRKFHLASLLQRGDLRAIFDDIKRVPLGWGLEQLVQNIDDVVPVLEKLEIFSDRVALWGSGEMYREFMHADDLASAVYFFMQPGQDSAAHEIINIGVGKDILIKDLAKKIAETCGYTGQIIFNNNGLNGTLRKLLSVDIAHDLGWQSQISLSAGIEDMYRYNYVQRVTSESFLQRDYTT